jgi:NAD(P)-dependent dehydrogenase (short-subunit alcohol dehydrogenase family)
LNKGRTLLGERLLLFGGSGSIGKAIHRKFREEGWQIIVVTRGKPRSGETIRWNPIACGEEFDPRDKILAIKALKDIGPFDAVCWAQGINCNDSVYNVDIANHEAVYRVNVLYILESLKILLEETLLSKPARLCIVSSIWQVIARQSKLSYCISKAALQGLVLSAATDLAKDGHVINAVLPGVIDTPMTRKNLTQDQIRTIKKQTLFGRLPTLEEVGSTVFSLCKSETTAVTGQFISVDLGYSNVRCI